MFPNNSVREPQTAPQGETTQPCEGEGEAEPRGWGGPQTGGSNDTETQIHSLATIQAPPKETPVYRDTRRPRTGTLTLRHLGQVAEVRF